jgi:hypothetical protein
MNDMEIPGMTKKLPQGHNIPILLHYLNVPSIDTKFHLFSNGMCETCYYLVRTIRFYEKENLCSGY